jgi:small neutral amino acid transporter SnatA (MarC family)
MSEVLLVLAFVSAVNPPRSRLGLPEDGRAKPGPEAMLVGSVVAIGVVAGLAWWSAPLLDALEITPETFRIAAGLVAVLAGGWAFFLPVPAVEPPLAGWRAGLWPVAYPGIVSPEVLLLAIAAGSQNGVARSVAAAVAAVAALGVLAAVPNRGSATRFMAATGRVLAVLLVVVGIFLMIDGIRDV